MSAIHIVESNGTGNKHESCTCILFLSGIVLILVAPIFKCDWDLERLFVEEGDLSINV